jgi:hypothetical protein
MTPEAREKLSRSLKAKWASGTRKPNPPETYVKASATHKKAFAEGRRVPVGMTSEQARERRSKYDRGKMMKVNRRVGDKKIGVPNPPGPSAKGPDHWKARYWILRSPDRRIIQGWNLSEIIRKNSHLFDEDDVRWYGKSQTKCRASKGLRSLFEMKKDGSGPKANSWKGWVAMDVLDEERPI